MFLDTFTSQLTINFINGVRRNTEDYEVIKSSKKPKQRLFLEYNDFDVWIQDILDDLKKGKKHYVFTPAKSGEKGVDAIAAVIAKHMGWKDNTQILSYFGEKEKEKKALSYIEKLCTNEEVCGIVTNTVISVGVNYDTADVFDEFFQSITRIRNPKDNVIGLFRTKKSLYGTMENNMNVPDCTVFERLRQDLQLEISANKNVKNWETFKLFMEMLDIKLTPKDKEWSMRAAAQTMDELMEDCELLLDWNRIPDVSDQLLCCINE
ncbi:hypothetical protein DFS34DRAFT_591389 [Phlyctochytrium arcticum]|nr:hypothetical protein DFS34DRAFT_591389 [Phlyctochytrium arcticum]